MHCLQQAVWLCYEKRDETHSQADEKMMERFKEIADPSVTSSEGGDQTTTRC